MGKEKRGVFWEEFTEIGEREASVLEKLIRGRVLLVIQLQKSGVSSSFVLAKKKSGGSRDRLEYFGGDRGKVHLPAGNAQLPRLERGSKKLND